MNLSIFHVALFAVAGSLLAPAPSTQPQDAAELQFPQASPGGKFEQRVGLTDVSVEWGGLAVTDVYPRRLPDLFADRPLRLTAHYAAAGNGTVTVHGRIAGRPFSQEVHVSLPASGDERPELSSMWARARIGDLTTAMVLAETPALVEQVTLLGLENHLLTDYTAFIAIDEGYHVDGAAVRVEEATELPDGMGRTSGGEASAHRARAAMPSVTVMPTSSPARGAQLGGLGVSARLDDMQECQHEPGGDAAIHRRRPIREQGSTWPEQRPGEADDRREVEPQELARRPERTRRIQRECCGGQ